MDKKTTYAAVAFLAVFVPMICSALAMLSKGALDTVELADQLVKAMTYGGIFAAIFYFWQRSKNSHLAQPPYAPSTKFYVATGLSLVFLALMGVGSGSVDAGNRAKELVDAETARKVVAAKAASAAEQKARLDAMTPKQRQELEIAETIKVGTTLLSQKEAHEKNPNLPDALESEWEENMLRLAHITRAQSNFNEAARLLANMTAIDRRTTLQHKKELAVETAANDAASLQSRKAYARTLESNFLEQRMDTTVSASGAKDTVLTIKWILATRVTANDLQQTGVLDQAKVLGFKKAIFTDGYDFSWSWSLSN